MTMGGRRQHNANALGSRQQVGTGRFHTHPLINMERSSTTRAPMAAMLASSCFLWPFSTESS